MKIIFYIIIVLAAITVGLYYFNPVLFQSVQDSVRNKVSTIIPIEPLTNSTTIYKWTNEQGELQISNNPPPQGIKYKTEQIKHSANVIPSQKLTGKTSEK